MVSESIKKQLWQLFKNMYQISERKLRIVPAVSSHISNTKHWDIEKGVTVSTSTPFYAFKKYTRNAYF